MRSAEKVKRKTADAGGQRNGRRSSRFFAGLEMPRKLVILDQDLIREIIQEREHQGIDQYDEVWEGVYIVPPLANIPHQDIVSILIGILFNVIYLEGRGNAFPGTNVSDRRLGWKSRFRAPDIVVVLKKSRAVDCTTHHIGSLDFLVEIQSPNDETDEKIPFYSKIGVRELLIIHRDSRVMRLYRHDGHELVLVEPTELQGGKWLVSEIVQLAFRRKPQRRSPQTEVQRTDGKAGHWVL